MQQKDVQGLNSADLSQKDAQGMEPSGHTHKMSIGLTIGMTIGVIGLIILLYGLFGGADYRHSDGININLWWGLVMVVFGILMAGGSYLVARAREAH